MWVPAYALSTRWAVEFQFDNAIPLLQLYGRRADRLDFPAHELFAFADPRAGRRSAGPQIRFLEVASHHDAAKGQAGIYDRRGRRDRDDCRWGWHSRGRNVRLARLEKYRVGQRLAVSADRLCRRQAVNGVRKLRRPSGRSGDKLVIQASVLQQDEHKPSVEADQCQQAGGTQGRGPRAHGAWPWTAPNISNCASMIG